jgi:hypothetical protein
VAVTAIKIVEEVSNRSLLFFIRDMQAELRETAGTYVNDRKSLSKAYFLTNDRFVV